MESISIGEEILNAIKLPKKDRQKMLKLELALALYQRGIISLGKGRKLAEMGKWEFIDELKKRKIERHYDERELKEDIEFVNRAQ